MTMQKVSENIGLIVLLVLMATSCMTQVNAIQDVNANGMQNHIIQKRTFFPLQPGSTTQHTMQPTFTTHHSIRTEP